MTPAIDETVDLSRYPIDRLDSDSGRALLARVRGALAENGACELPGFLTAAAIQVAIDLAGANRGTAFRMEQEHDIEFTDADPATLPTNDIHRHRVRTAKGGIAYDTIPAHSPARIVFESDLVAAFIGQALGVDPLHRMDDPLGVLNVMFYEPGDELGWHFDSAEFVVTLMLQAPEHGGVFEFVPMLRSEHDANDEGVRALLDGERDGICTLSCEPGTLVLFRGHWSPHRVTPVEGTRPRINAVLAYSRRPDHRLTPSGQMRFYGRVLSEVR